MKNEITERYLSIIRSIPNMDENRAKWQLDAISAIRNNEGNGIVLASVGSGKTYIMIFIILYLNKYSKNYKINIVVPNLSLYEDWIKEDGYIKKFNLKNVTPYVINTFISTKTNEADVIFYDEVHRTGAETFKLALEKPSKFKIGLTGTLEREDLNHYLIKDKINVVYELSKEDATKLGYIVKTNIINFGIKPDTSLLELEKSINDFFARFYKSYDLLRACALKSEKSVPVTFLNGIPSYNNTGQVIFKTPEMWRQWLSENSDLPMQEIYKLANTCSAMIIKRARIIYNSPEKVQKVIQLCDAIKDKKTIIFSKTIETADEIAEKIENCVTYHSGVKSKEFIVGNKLKKFSSKKVKESNMNKFLTNEINKISVINCINEGFNDEEVEVIIQLAYDKSKINNEQRNGRGVRKSKTNPNKVCTVVNFYLVGTQEEKWLKNKQKADKKVKWIFNMQELISSVQ